MNPARNRILSHLALLVAMAFWGSSFSVLRIALTAFSPVQTMASRMTIGFLVFMPILPTIWRELRKYGHWGTLVLLGLCEPCLYFLFETYALRLTTSSQAGMITSLLPMLVAVLAFLFLKEKIRLNMWAGFLVAVAGIVWLTLTSSSDETAVSPLWGNILECLAMTVGAVYPCLARRLSSQYGAMTITAVQSAVGMVFFAVLCLVVPAPERAVQMACEIPSWLPWACIVYLGGVVTLLGYGLFNMGVKGLSASQASAYTNLIPVFGVLFGLFFLNEQLLAAQYGGIALIIAGVILSQIRTAGPPVTRKRVVRGGHSAQK